MSRFKLEGLKKIRVIVSLSVFILISLLFLDPTNSIPSSVNVFFGSLQLIPAIAKLIVYTGFSTLGLAFILLLTAAFGRVYCSTLCPLGTFQDIVIYAGKKINKRRRFKYVRPHFLFHYSALLLTAILVLGGSFTLLNLLEPFSNWGRSLTMTIEPLSTFINNLIAYALSKAELYFLYNVPLREIQYGILLGPVIFILLVGYLSYKHGRLFCNSLCPAGALLGLISRFAVYKIAVNEKTCTECGACEKVCKANCIESGTKLIEFAACVGCFNCIRSCPADGIIFETVKPRQRPSVGHNPGRRKFFREISTPSLGLVLPAFIQKDSADVKSGYLDSRKVPVTPPGSVSIRHFTSLCTACHLCVSICPSQVIYPSFLDYGASGIFQPKMNFDASYCNYDCVLCGDVCPTGAILPVTVDAKKLIQIGRASFVRDDCVVVAKKKDCAACSEHCPTKAVQMVPYEGKLRIPELNNDICVGCGACEHACPTTPRKAIYVASNAVHRQAQKPKVKKQENIFDVKDDFPF